MSVIGIDLGGTKLAAGVLSPAGELVRRESVALDGRTGGDVGALVSDQVRELIRSAESGGSRIHAVGIAVPGIYRSATGTVWAPNIPRWDDYALLDEIRAAAGDSIAVSIESDRACYILGETWRGAARGCHNAIFVAVGTGIGAGILTDGRIVSGQGGIAGAIGWLALDRPYRAGYESVGCFEYHASGTGIAGVARRRLAEDEGHEGPMRQLDPARITARDVFDAYEAGDSIARSVLDDAIAFWGMAAANLVSLFDPEVIVFGGGVFGPAARFLDRIRSEAQRWAQPVSMAQVKLEVSTLGGDAGLYGACRLATLAVEAGASPQLLDMEP